MNYDNDLSSYYQKQADQLKEQLFASEQERRKLEQLYQTQLESMQMQVRDAEQKHLNHVQQEQRRSEQNVLERMEEVSGLRRQVDLL